MNSKTLKIEELEHKVLTPEEGRALVRISDGMRFPGELTLGFTYYLGGELLKEPIWELPEHYREEDLTEEELEYLNNEQRRDN